MLSSDILLISVSVFADNLLDALTVDDVVAISLSYPGFDVLLVTISNKLDNSASELSAKGKIQRHCICHFFSQHVDS